MLTREFLAHRAAELKEFFENRFGRNWRGALRTHLRFHPAHTPKCLAIAAPLGNVRSFMVMEEVAVTLGFRPGLTPDVRPFERTRAKRVESLVSHLGMVVFAPASVPKWHTVCRTILHKNRRQLAISDVVSPENVEFLQPAIRTSSPCVPSQECETQGLSLTSLVSLDQVAAETPHPPVPPEGGAAGPHISLRRARRLKEPSRETLKGDASGRLSELKQHLDELHQDTGITRVRRLTTIERARTYATGLIEQSLDELTVDGRTLVAERRAKKLIAELTSGRQILT